MHNHEKRPDRLIIGVVKSVDFDRKLGKSLPDRFHEGGGGRYFTARTAVIVPIAQESLINFNS